MIEVQLPDGSKKEFPAGSSAYDVAASIGDRLAAACIAAEVNGVIVDLSRPLPEEGTVQSTAVDRPRCRSLGRAAALLCARDGSGRDAAVSRRCAGVRADTGQRLLLRLRPGA